MEVDLSKFNNSEFKPGGTRLKRAFWFYTNLIIFKSGWFPFYGMKRFLLKAFGAKIGKNVVIKPHVNIKHPWNLVIEENSWIGEKVWIDNLSLVEIGKNCCISQGALILCGNHNFKKESFDLMTSPIILENGVWLGAKSTVTGGVICHSHAILSAGSTTSKNLDSYAIYRGNPAEKTGERKFIDE